MAPLETLNCSECGALLQVPAVARFVTCNRCGAHLVVQRTGVATYTETTRKPPPEAGVADPAVREMASRLEQLENESELARIDREWDRERERHMVQSRYGRRYVPSAAAAVVMGVLGAGFGLFWTVMTLNMAGGLGGAFPLFGVLFVCLAAGISIHQFNKARRYRAAYEAYQRRRTEARERAQGRDDPSELI